MRKLIRDKLSNVIPDNELELAGSEVELQGLLRAKLFEELNELNDSNYKDVDEYADLMEVILTIAEIEGVTKVDIEARRIEKLYERGGFNKGLILNRGNTEWQV